VFTFLLDILSLAGPCALGDFAGEECQLCGVSSKGSSGCLWRGVMALGGWRRTYELSDAAPCEATIGREVALVCQLNGGLGLVVEDL
jgi:hypothetical protein